MPFGGICQDGGIGGRVCEGGGVKGVAVGGGGNVVEIILVQDQVYARAGGL